MLEKVVQLNWRYLEPKKKLQSLILDIFTKTKE